MSAPDARSTARPGGLRVTIALWLALQAMVIPLFSVIAPGLWVVGALALPALLLMVGYLLRRRRLPAVAVSAVELAVWVAVITLVGFPSQSLLGVIPTGGVFDAARLLVQSASNEILLGAAPLPASAGVNFLVVASIGLLTIALDHVVLTARMPLLAGIALVAVWLVPAIAVPSGVDVIAFAVLAASLLFLIRAETRTRERVSTGGGAAGVTPVAIAIGAVAIVAALVAAPALPPPPVTAAGGGLVASIDASLDLGDDLRQRSDVPVLSTYSDAPTPPYLRVATLSVFDGEVWMPDRLRSVPLEEAPLAPVTVDEGIRLTEYRTFVSIDRLSSAYLPVPFPTVGVSGLDGLWRSVPYNRTIQTGESNAQGQQYEVVTHLPRPSLEQIRAAQTEIAESRVDLQSLPEGAPPIVSELAAHVTAGATTDYDRLIALQDWFRGPEFTYSLTAPVADGFDGSSADAVAEFLEQKEGYCVHFAGAFALMARSLEIPTRIAVGFLPGAFTGESVDGMRVAEASTAQLHAWPEVYFSGIGWVQFEPTKSLGTQTRFVPAASAPTDEGGTDVGAPTPTPTATPSSTAAPNVADRDADTQAGAITARAFDPRPAATVIGIVLIVLLAPAAAGALRRGVLLRRARSGTVTAAWRYVQDAAIDLGVDVTTSETPRAFGSRLVSVAGAPPQETRRLVAAVEHASYAPSPSASAGDIGRDAATVRAGLRTATSGRTRLIATLLPRSLVVRPGSAFAERVASVPASAR
ncbi:DUF3488 and transglutaminase-like domain-containing protein [uncultured Microbacterium sp.]|uniref:transglutaminase TgpA family protein n=1 Tax=uncultured Microbacterium sp. TaxID=191216 RepID=UPI00260F3C65|nr:DUF3488 and transglutaminase-like domain-containing protein [uncultured Microbacterium sp.]